MNYTRPLPLAKHIPHPSVSWSPQRVFHSCSKQVTPTGHGWYPACIYSSPILLLLFLKPAGRASSWFLWAPQEPRCCDCDHSAILKLALLHHLSSITFFSCWGHCCSEGHGHFRNAGRHCWCSHATIILLGTGLFWAPPPKPCSCQQPEAVLGSTVKSGTCQSPGWAISNIAFSPVGYKVFFLSFSVY